MLQNWLYILMAIGAVNSYPYLFETKKFKVGIEYDGSIPMKGGSERYRHRNNLDPFFVTTTVEARAGFVITYLDVTATVDLGGELDFSVVRGSAGSTRMTFQLVSNHSDFLSYSYLSYGIREEEYNKVANIITIPATSAGYRLRKDGYTIITVILSVIRMLIKSV